MRLRAFASLVPLLLLGLRCSSSDGGGPDGGSADVAPEAAPSIDAPVIPDRYAAFATAFDIERKALKAPGASVAIVEHGQLTFAHGFGTKGPNSTDPVLASTLFRIGSMTKALTATALLQQVHAGKVDLQAHVKDILPTLAINDAQLAEMTVQEAITHQTGLYDYLAVTGTSADSSLQSFLSSGAFSNNEYFMSPPGSMWNYSNPNFYIAGAIAEKASGTFYRDLVTQNVLQPLGMTRTFFSPADVVADGDFSNGKSLDNANALWDVSPTSYDNAWARPAGYAFSSALDYAKFTQFLMAGNDAVLSPDMLAAMQTSQVDTREQGDVEHYGYALFVDDGIELSKDDWRTVKIITHSGAIPGYATEFWMVPSTGFAIVTCANTDGAYFRSSLGNALAHLADLPPTSTPPNLTVDPATLDSMTGDYDDAHNVGKVHVTNQNGTLTVSMPDLDASHVPYVPTLSPLSPDTFLISVQGAQLPVTFIRNTQGEVMYMRTRIFVATRIAGNVVKPHVAHAIDPIALARSLRTMEALPFR